MKKIIHSILKKYGFRIENRKKMFQNRSEYLTKYSVFKYKQVFLDSYEYVIKLEKYFTGLNFQDSEYGILVTLESLKFYVETKEEFLIICEIYIDKDYNFLYAKECIIIDIGCNIGLATLFFSSNMTVKKVYSFEPVTETYDLAKRNFLLNPEINSKITSFNFGLGKSNRKEIFLFDNNIKGNTGIRGNKSASYNISQSKQEIEVEIKDISKIFISIYEAKKQENFIVKMDCEGSEYEIMQRLDETNLLSKIKVFMIEWHDEGSKVLEDILIRNNFVVFSRNLTINSGMLYAYNTK
nr:FkbM family methyltransferase [uncultured Flavobacterium sp.]